MTPLAADVCAEIELPGIEPAPAPGLAHIAVLGRLVNPARVYTLDERTVQIELLVRQADPAHPHAANILARCSFGSEQLLEVQAGARHLLTGTEVLVSGTGIDHYASRQHGHVLRLLRVNHYAAIRHDAATAPTTRENHHAQQPAAAPAAAVSSAL